MSDEKFMERFAARVLVEGSGRGEALVLPEPLSLWGGLDPQTGEIIDRRHPCLGAGVAGRALVMPCGRGSSSASSVLLEAVRAGTAPAAILLIEPDAILALGATIAHEMYGTAPPIAVLEPRDYDRLRNGQIIEVEKDGTITIFAKNSE